MEFRLAEEKEIDRIMEIINQAKEYFKENNINQWQNNYPNSEVIKGDIKNNNSYVLLDDNKIIATAVASFDGEKSYESIYEGQWIGTDDFVVIHRIAVDNTYKGNGAASQIIKFIEKLCLNKGIYSIKIDTHQENLSMQRTIKKNGFEYCGIIYLSDGGKRIAFEKILK